MLSNLKLASYSWIFALIMLSISAVIITSSYFIEKNIIVIDDTWQLYQTDLSEKARLEGALRAAIGYGGMIHNLKNYVLRSDEDYKRQAELQLAAAQAFLQQYKALEVTNGEASAINDILNVLLNYQKALVQIQSMIANGHSISEINDAIIFNDVPAIRGLRLLRNENLITQKNNHQLNKTRIIADLRAALGYGGMIHKFKDYILNHNKTHSHDDDHIDTIQRDEIETTIQAATHSINQYRQLSINESEKIALNDIEITLSHYSDKLKEIESIMLQNISLKDSDTKIKVDDTLALRGFRLLGQAINQDIAEQSRYVTASLESVMQTVKFSRLSIIFTLLFITLISIILLRYYVIQPILNLTKNMVRLADNQLDTEIAGNESQNEIGQMARSVIVFKANLTKLFESEEISKNANNELHQQLKENERLRNRSEEQTSKALFMSGQMVSARQSAEKAMARAEKDELFISSVLNAVRDGVITINAKGIIETFNPGAETIFGYKAHEIINKNISLLMPEPERSAHDGHLKAFSEGKSTRDQSSPMEQIALRKNGETFPAEITLNTIKIAGEVKITGLVRDITERKEKEAQIEKLAMTDSLTGLANRHQYDQRLHEITQQAKRFKTQFCLMMIDLDKFKPVNDTYGHHVGDVLLQKVAEILVFCCRETDTVARLGGDEFAIILNGIHDPKEVGILAERILDKLKIQFVIENHHIQIGASIGISCYPSDTTDIKSLQKMADKALYLSKNSGRNTYRYYHESLTTQKDSE